MEPEKYFPWIAGEIRNSHCVIFSRLDDLPPAASLDKQFLLHYGTKSGVMIPLVESGTVLGLITFVTLQKKREWHEQTVNRLRLVARIFAQAIARRQTDQALQDSEARLALAAESANASLWDMNVGSGEIWATPKTHELFGLATDGGLTLDRILGTVHPEDVEMVRQAFDRSIQSGEYARTDFRVMLPDSSIRWLTSRGRTHAKSPGEPVRVMGVALDITERKGLEEELQTRLHEITDLKKQLEQENLYLKEEFRSLNDQSELVGQSKPMQKVFQQIQQVASTDSHVLIMGETGTGKELVSRAIHAASKRKDRILVKVNCATLPSTLIESELFGREKGAYTGALTRQIGRFELADKGTIFLDEIGELSMDLQSKLLRVLQEQEFERLGGTKTIRVDVRVIAATNRNLVEAVQKGDFRKDLYYRLSVFPIEVPPLRAHAEDIPLLVWAFIDQLSQRMGKTIKSISPKTMNQLIRYPWPGNIRELRNTIERAMIISVGDRLEVQLPDDSRVCDSPTLNFREAEQQIIGDALQRANWRHQGAAGCSGHAGPETLDAIHQNAEVRDPQSPSPGRQTVLETLLRPFRKRRWPSSGRLSPGDNSTSHNDVGRFIESQYDLA